MLSFKTEKVEAERLKIFDMVMKTQNLSHAAALLNISYSSVHFAIRKLRVLYNDLLFIHDKKTMVPTAFALLLHSEMQAFMNTPQPDSVLTNDEQGNIRFVFSCESHIAAIVTPLAFLSMQNLAPFPLVHIPLPSTVQNKTDILLNNKADVVLDYSPLEHEDICSKRLFKEDYVIVCSNTHPRLFQSITHKEFCQEKHAVQTTLSGVDSQTKFSNAHCALFSSHNYLDLLAIVEVSELICVVPLNIYLKLNLAFSIKTLSYNFKLNIQSNRLYINYLKDPFRPVEKKCLLEKIKKMY
ncbi:LysR family transcriptional activator for leuABCD operon [Lelliottia nimipressuralis]|uniref:LysR family transcriptional regulator n=1 Tax=Lelliottia nimipressuralis TaxID=69220 RepID=UPI003D1EF142